MNIYTKKIAVTPQPFPIPTAVQTDRQGVDLDITELTVADLESMCYEFKKGVFLCAGKPDNSFENPFNLTPEQKLAKIKTILESIYASGKNWSYLYRIFLDVKKIIDEA